MFWRRAACTHLSRLWMPRRVLLRRGYVSFASFYDTPSPTAPLDPKLTSVIDDHRYSELLTSPQVYDDPEFINKVMLYVLDNCPDMNLTMSESDIEIPYYRFAENHQMRHINVDTPFYHYIYLHIPKLYQFLRLVEPMMFNNRQFHQYLVWLAFHMDDSATIQRLTFSGDEYDVETLGYMVALFIQNYELDFTKRVVTHWLDKRQLSDPLRLLEVIFAELDSVDALLSNYQFFFRLWRDKQLPISGKALYLLLRQYTKYGNADHMNEIKSYLDASPHRHHYLVSTVLLQHRIRQRSPNHKKPITEEDVIELGKISETTSLEEELIDLYYNWLKFFAVHLSFTYIQLVLAEMKRRHLTKSPLFAKFHLVVVRHFGSNLRFFDLWTYMKALVVSNNEPFSEPYLVAFFEAFVATYPHYVPQFKRQFDDWLVANFASEDVTRLSLIFSVTKVVSQVTPYNLDIQPLRDNPKKYSLVYWKDISWSRQEVLPKKIVKDQVNYRATRGFADVIKKGVRVDSLIVEATFRRADLSTRNRIIELCRTMDMLPRLNPKFELYKVQANQNPRALQQFMKHIDSLGTNDRIVYARMLMNAGLGEQCKSVLATLTGLTDHQKMVTFIIGLRNHINSGAYDDAINHLQSFPLDHVVLLPFLFNQGCYIEKHLVSKIEQKRQHNNVVNDNLLRLTSILQGFLGDVNLRVERDSQELESITEEMLLFIETWMNGVTPA